MATASPTLHVYSSPKPNPMSVVHGSVNSTLHAVPTPDSSSAVSDPTESAISTCSISAMPAKTRELRNLVPWIC